MAKPDFQNLPTRLGVYSLTREIGHNATTTLYLATQSHVERGVLVEVLNPKASSAEVESFLSTVRARVAVHLPHVCDVFESMVSDEIWYVTLERPEGRNITKLVQEKRNLSPMQVCAVIQAAAKLYRNAEEQNVAAGPLSTDTIFLSGKEEISFLSPVLPGEHSAELLIQQMDALAAALRPVLPQSGVPGQSRVATLVSWIAEGYEGQRLDWESIATTANTICEQLAPQLRKEHVHGINTMTRGAIVRQSKRERRKMVRYIWMGAAAALTAVIGGIAGCMSAPDEVPPLSPNDGTYIHCRSNGAVVRVSAHALSIGEYKDFLAAMDNPDRVPKERRRQLHKDVPQDCTTNHKPFEWEDQLKAARSGGKYRGEVLTESSPVRGLNYWDALVCARYFNATLPAAELLQGAHKEGAATGTLHEWTTGRRNASTLFTEGYILLSPCGTPLLEADRANKSHLYGARLVFPPVDAES